MEAHIGLAGALVGGFIALVGQLLMQRAEARRERSHELHDLLATIISLSEDYRNRIWEERNGLNEVSVSEFDLKSHREAQVRFSLIVTQEEVISAATRLQQSQQDLGKLWRTTRMNGPEIQKAWDENRGALQDFTAASRDFLKSRRRKAW